MAGRPAEMLDSPGLDSKLLMGSGSNLLDEGDDSSFLQLTRKDMERFNLIDTPPVSRVKQQQATRNFSSPSKVTKRPSWGPKSSPSKGRIRLLEGIEDDAGPSRPPAEIRRKERTLGGLGQDKSGSLKARQSIFAKPTYVSNQQYDVQYGDNELEGGEESFYKNPALSSSSSSVKDRIAAIEAGRGQDDKSNGQASSGNGSANESNEQLDNQLKELKKMNDVFEAYERMLHGSANQIENFTQRIAETNSLLDVYIDLMRQADRTQQLLLDGDWKGASEDEAAHALALELAERERRRKEEEAEQAAQLAVQKKQEAERARLESQQADLRKASLSSSRGGRGGSNTRGGMSASVRGRGAAATSLGSRIPPASSRVRPIGATSTTRGASSSARGGSTASTTGGLNNKYASVRSSGYGPPK